VISGQWTVISSATAELITVFEKARLHSVRKTRCFERARL
jgi:CHAT domain-containing protein